MLKMDSEGDDKVLDSPLFLTKASFDPADTSPKVSGHIVLDEKKKASA